VTVTSPAPNLDLLTAARQWYDAGYCVVPSHEDGGKRPFGAWKQYQTERPTFEQVEAWLATGRYTGIGVITGAVSGNVEMIELEGPEPDAVQAFNKIRAKAVHYSGARGIDLSGTFAKIGQGCVERSAGGGLHMFVRSTEPVPGNTKLASDEQGHVISETRGEGGFVIVAPTPARSGHGDGTIYMLIGDSTPDKTPTIDDQDLQALHFVISEALHTDTQPLESPGVSQAQTTTPTPVAASQGQEQGLAPWDDYARRTSWAQILAPLGWQQGMTAPDGRTHWTRPGKDPREGASATTIEDGPFYVFSTSTQFPDGVGMSKQHVYAFLHHDGDHKAAARALLDEGYGEREPGPPLPEWVMEEIHDKDETAEPLDPKYLARLAERFFDLKVTRDAKQLLAAEQIKGAPPLAGINLREFLAQPDAPERYRIGNLWPLEGRVLLAAAAKSGKTTMVAANLIPSLVDGGQFLGQFAPEPVTGTVVLLNMEVGENTLRRWMRDAGITNTGNVVVENLRGKASALSLHTEQGRKRFGAWLADHGAQVVILDPLAPLLATLGLDENANADVATFFSWWSEALHIGGVTDDLVVHHTGHAGERSRGASRLLDEPDAIWTLGKEADSDDDGEFASLQAPPRWLSAYGRDVDLRSTLLDYNEATRHMTLTDQPRSAATGMATERRILHVMRDQQSRSKSAIKKAVGGNHTATLKVIESLIEQDVLIKVGPGTNGYPVYNLNEAS
jgi:hypothetical protein